MKHWLIYSAIGIASWLLPHQSYAQDTDIGISGVGLLSIQPVDDAYVGGPYLSEGVGGVGPGFGAGLSVITSSGVVFGAEYSTAFFEQEQSGRLVGGSGPNEGAPHSTRLRDSLLSGLIGYRVGPPNTRVLLLGGIGATLDSPTIDGVPRDPDASLEDDGLPFVLSGGVDVLQRLNPRTSLVLGARYTPIDRPETHRYLGIGRHVLRASIGLRVRLN
jgi:hypothetical protein